MRILVMSDSHGNENAVFRAIGEQPEAQVIIHLGDGEREARAAAARFCDRTFHIVCGNCDYGAAFPTWDTAVYGGQRLYLTHGFAERVKSGLLTLLLTAQEKEANAALYGHTHLPLIDFRNGILLFNPGSIGSSDPTYGVLDCSPSGLLPRIVRLSR